MLGQVGTDTPRRHRGTSRFLHDSTVMTAEALPYCKFSNLDGAITQTECLRQDPESVLVPQVVVLVERNKGIQAH
jgi:hypothetical protein